MDGGESMKIKQEQAKEVKEAGKKSGEKNDAKKETEVKKEEKELPKKEEMKEKKKEDKNEQPKESKSVEAKEENKRIETREIKDPEVRAREPKAAKDTKLEKPAETPRNTSEPIKTVGSNIAKHDVPVALPQNSNISNVLTESTKKSIEHVDV